MRIATLIFIFVSTFSAYDAAITVEIHPFPAAETFTIDIDIMALPLESKKALPPCRPLPKKFTTEDFGRKYREKDGWKILWIDLNADGICDGILQKNTMVRELAPHFPRLIPAVGLYVFSQGKGRPRQIELGDGQRNGWISVYYAEPNKPPFIIHYLKDVGRWQPSMYVILRGDQRYIEYRAGAIVANGVISPDNLRRGEGNDFIYRNEESDGFIARHYLLLSDYYQDWRKRTKKRDNNIERELFAMEANILDPEFVKRHSKTPTQ